MPEIISELQWRGLVHQTTEPAPQMAAWLNEAPRTLYAGFDPTADSMHVGHLIPLLMLRRFQSLGHKPIALVGGATGMIGDPSGKSEERNLLSLEDIDLNVRLMKEQMKRFLAFDSRAPNCAELVNNYEWMRDHDYLSFLREVGKHFPVNVMLAKDSVKARLESDAGISYTEFSYMLIQAYDFVQLCGNHGCQLQIGGSDQWGNITAGIELARRMRGAQLRGLTCPLLLKSDGSKMGKTESGTIWLSADRTSEYKFYQYWINVSDDDVGMCLRFLTDLPHEQIEALDAVRRTNPERRESQTELASELTKLVHRDFGLELAKRMTEAFFGEAFNQFNWTESQLLEICADFPTTAVSRDRLSGDGWPLADAIFESGLAKSKSEARRIIQQGGAYVNGVRMSDINAKLTTANLASETVMVLRSGKKSYALLRFNS